MKIIYAYRAALRLGFSAAMVLSLLCAAGSAQGQDSTNVEIDDEMAALLNKADKPTVNYAFATFKSTRVCNVHSIETIAKKHLDFRISHRFGALSTGPYDWFGLDDAQIRLGLEYGILDRLMVGVGRSSYNKVYDGFAKLKVLRQSTGARFMPVSVTVLANIMVDGRRWSIPSRTNYFTSRLAYCAQVLIARKFHERFSFQLSPTVLHRNLVLTKADENTLFSLGYGMRFKVSRRISINAEVVQLFPGETNKKFDHSMSLGVDIETGGHVFQLFFSNSQQMVEKGFIAETNGRWWNGDIHFGFNISRVFSFDSKNKPKNWDK